MNNKYNYIIGMLLVIFVLFSIIKCQYVVEDFTPGIRQFYRPYLRQYRGISSNFFESFKNKGNKYLKKANLI